MLARLLFLPADVPTNNTLYQTQCAFVFVLSVMFLGEAVTRAKVVCVTVAFAGVACVCAVPTESSSGGEKSNTAWGIALALASTACYATYEVAFDLFASRKLRKSQLLASPDAEPLLPGNEQRAEEQRMAEVRRHQRRRERLLNREAATEAS